MGEVTVFQCGAPKDHKCDDDGPVVCGGENEDGTYWTGPDTPTNRAINLFVKRSFAWLVSLTETVLLRSPLVLWK